MSRLILTIVAAVAPCAAPGLAMAETSTPRAAGPYLRLGGGVAFGETLRQDIAYNPAILFPVTPPDAKTTDLGSGASYAAAIGFQYPGRTRTELEYRRMSAKVDAVAFSGGTPPAPVVAPDDDVTADALMSNVYVDFAGDRPLTPFVGVGVGGARVTNELGERDAAFAYQARAGVDLKIGAKAAIGVEYVYFRTLDVVYGPKDFAAGGVSRTDGDPFVASSVMATLRFNF